MRIQFTYTIEDLKETLAPPMNAARRAARTRRRIVNIISWIFAAVCIGWVLWIRSMVPALPWELDGTPIDFFSDILPALLGASYIYLIFGTVGWKSLRGPRKGPQDSATGKRNLRLQLIGVWFGLMIAAGVLLLLHRDFILLIWPTRTERILLSGGPWALAIALLIVSGKLQRRVAARNQWRSQPGWSRPKTVEIDITGYHASDEVTQHHYAWCHFTRARETDSLFILHAEDTRQHMIPKRAFAGPADLQSCRSLLQSMIAKVDFQVAPTGFEVITRSVLPLPLPEIPVQSETSVKDVDLGQVPQTSPIGN